MEFFYKKFNTKQFTLYPLGDFHFGSKQCNEEFIKQVIEEIYVTDNAYWVGMGDLMENAIIGSKSDIYEQVLPPKEQMDYIVNLLKPIESKGLFFIAGNHERRTHRLVGLIPEEYLALQLGVPFKGFSCYSIFSLPSSKGGRGQSSEFRCYFHHQYGGGWTFGGKVNTAHKLRQIAPTADAIFSGHFHITSRIPVTWFEPARVRIVKKVGYDYITGSALDWSGSYAEEKAKPAATMEFIKITFISPTIHGTKNVSRDIKAGKQPYTKFYDNRKQIYEVITPRGKI